LNRLPALLGTRVGEGLDGQPVISVTAPIEPVGWHVVAEAPLKEALGPLYNSGIRTAVLLALGLALAALAAAILARRMVVPIRLMQAGAARFGAGDLDQRMEIHTGDELEGLADEFNRMAGDLQRSYSNLEAKVEERTAELTEALDVIASSISYASRIQRAILPESGLFDTILSDYFILWEPRDVVSGDMYWLTRWGEGVLLILGDCTGHGVPGAFVTLIASAALDQAQLDVEPGAVGKLIERTNQLIKNTLKQSERHGESDDGCDLGVCYISAKGTRVTFAGAGISLLSAPPGEDLVETKGDKRGIGYRRVAFDQTYSETVLPVVPGTRFYMSSDGLIDQIGGERRRAFGDARLRSLLDQYRDQPMANQKSLLVAALAEYQGREIRRDDVSLLGFRLHGPGLAG
jgi:serine phosphatase RsbU (regulator of sigma subunit)